MTRRRSLVSALAVSALVLGLVGPSPAVADAGDLATGFGIDGRVVTSHPNASTVVDSVVLPNGRILALFSEFNGTEHAAVLRRFRPSGAVDASFGVAGRVAIDEEFEPAALALSEGRIVVVGTREDTVLSQRWISVWRLSAAGVPDPTFDGDGEADPIPDHTSARVAIDVAVESSGKVVVLAQQALAVGSLILRLDLDGSLDTSFSADGMQVANLGSANNFPVAVAVTPTNKIVFTGSALMAYDAPDLEIGLGVGRLKANGAWDTSFSGDGQVLLGAGLRTVIEPEDLVLAGGGRVVVVGSKSVQAVVRRTRATPLARVVVARFTSAGALDDSFSRDGISQFLFSDDDSRGVALARQADGKILVAADASPAGRIGIARVTTSGRLDRTFSTDGRAIVRFATPANSFAVALGVTPNERRLIVVGGEFGNTGGFGMAAIRLT